MSTTYNIKYSINSTKCCTGYTVETCGFTSQPAPFFSSLFTHQNQHQNHHHQRRPDKKPDFYDTCDAGVLIGKLPCLESTLAQSVADTPGRRQGRPGVTYHMNCSFVSCGGKQRKDSPASCLRESPRGVTVTQTRVQTRYVQHHTAVAPLPSSPSGKQHCLSAIREPTEQYWRLEAAAATAHRAETS